MKAVKEQLALLENPELTRSLKVKGETTQQRVLCARWFETPEGTALAPRFGVRALEIAPGCTALKVGNKTDLKRLLEGLGAAAHAGELDAALEAALPKPPGRTTKGKSMKG